MVGILMAIWAEEFVQIGITKFGCRYVCHEGDIRVLCTTNQDIAAFSLERWHR
jgi:hypothetical protein